MKELKSQWDDAMRHYVYYSKQLSDTENTLDDLIYCSTRASHWQNILNELTIKIEETKNKENYGETI